MKKWQKYAALIAVLLMPHFAQAANASNRLDELSGFWDDFEPFVSFGTCASAPSDLAFYTCSPMQLEYVKHPALEGAGFISATNTVIDMADTLRKKEMNYSDITAIFNQYNYSDMLIAARIDYVAKGWYIGVRPVRVAAKFELHNPNLPLGSLTYRDDLEFFVAHSVGFKLGELNVSFGAQATAIRRNEVLAESTLLDFASESPGDLLATQTELGVFADAGVYVELPKVFAASFYARDLGHFWRGTDLSSNYLYIEPDHTAKAFSSFSFIPQVGPGQLQVGVELVSFFDDNNSFSNQWLGSLAYYLGPFRFLSAMNPDLIRTGLELHFGKYQVSVANEWLNQLEANRQAQPRFVLGVSAEL